VILAAGGRSDIVERCSTFGVGGSGGLYGICLLVRLSGTAVGGIVADDASYCRYNAEAGLSTYEICTNRLAGSHRQAVAASVNRIEGYALLNGPAPMSTDVTGSINTTPAQPKPTE